VRERLGEICQRFGVASLYAFGSRAREALGRISGTRIRGEAPNADLDLAAQPGKGALATSLDRVRLMAALEDLFDVPRVDLVILPEADPFLAAEAIRGELLYCDDEDRQAEEELYYLARAGDLAPFERERIQGVLKGELTR